VCLCGDEDRTKTDESSIGGAGGHDILTRADTEGFPADTLMIVRSIEYSVECSLLEISESLSRIECFGAS